MGRDCREEAKAAAKLEPILSSFFHARCIRPTTLVTCHVGDSKAHQEFIQCFARLVPERISDRGVFQQGSATERRAMNVVTLQSGVAKNE